MKHPAAMVASFFGLLAAATSAVAHNPDTSYARLRISEDWLEARFTYDLEALQRMTAVDANGDGQITRAEVDSAVPQIRRFLRGQIRLEMNEFEVDFGEAEPPVWPEGVAAVGPGDYQTTLVHFPFRKRIQGLPESVGITIFVFDTLGDRHTVLGTFEEPGRLPYEVVFNQFEPDFLYFLELQPSPDGQYEQLLNFMKLGVEHIFIGYDHILFLLALVVVSRFKTLLAVITSFTAAHTITLILAALEVVWLPTRLIETAIAATIMYVAVENLYVKEPKRRWMLTFAFGLVHGFGFANVLRETGLPPTGLVRCLVSFNVGVELGQLAIVAAVWPLWRLVAKQKWGQRVTQVVGVGILLFGLAWFLDRALGLRMMPI